MDDGDDYDDDDDPAVTLSQLYFFVFEVDTADWYLCRVVVYNITANDVDGEGPRAAEKSSNLTFACQSWLYLFLFLGVDFRARRFVGFFNPPTSILIPSPAVISWMDDDNKEVKCTKMNLKTLISHTAHHSFILFSSHPCSLSSHHHSENSILKKENYCCKYQCKNNIICKNKFFFIMLT